VIYFRVLKFVLLLASEGACTGLNGHCARETKLIANRICECTDCLKAVLRSGMTSFQFMVASARSVSCGSNEAVILLCLVPLPSTLT